MPSHTKSAPKFSGEYTTKKCPNCFTYLPLNAKRCNICNHRVGPVNKIGFATKPFDWWAYLLAAGAIAAFAVFVWWGFFRE